MGDFFNRRGVVKGDDAGERDVKIQCHGLLGECPVFGKAMDDAADAICAFFFEDADGVLAGFAGVDNQGFFGDFGGLDMIAEALMLPSQIAFAAEIIQPGFANGNNFWVIGEVYQFFGSGVVSVADIGMDADAERNFRIIGNQVLHGRKGFQINGNTEQVVNLAVSGVLHKAAKIVLERG